MSLARKILAVAEKPGSVKARVMLAAELGRMGIEESASVWDAALQLAMMRGEFFTALAMCRLHFREESLNRHLRRLASFFSIEARRDRPVMGAMEPEPWDIEIPEEHDYQVVMGLKIGTILTGLQLPEEVRLPQIPIFSELSVEDFVTLAIEVEPFPLKAGQLLMKQGETEQAAYLLSHGVLKIEQERNDGEVIELATVDAPALVGEMYMLTLVPRRASVRSVRTGMAWRIDAELLTRLSRSHPALNEQLQSLFKKRLLQNLVVGSELLEKMADRDKLLRTFQVRSIRPGEEVFAQGISAQGIFVILHGEGVVMARKEDGRRVHVASLFEGDTFGEISTLTGEHTSAAVWMPEGGLLLHLPSDSYYAIRQFLPELEEKLKEMMERRKSELSGLVESLDSGFEQLGDAWLLSEADLPFES